MGDEILRIKSSSAFHSSKDTFKTESPFKWTLWQTEIPLLGNYSPIKRLFYFKRSI